MHYKFTKYTRCATIIVRQAFIGITLPKMSLPDKNFTNTVQTMTCTITTQLILTNHVR